MPPQDEDCSQTEEEYETIIVAQKKERPSDVSFSFAVNQPTEMILSHQLIGNSSKKNSGDSEVNPLKKREVKQLQKSKYLDIHMEKDSADRYSLDAVEIKKKQTKASRIVEELYKKTIDKHNRALAGKKRSTIKDFKSRENIEQAQSGLTQIREFNFETDKRAKFNGNLQSMGLLDNDELNSQGNSDKDKNQGYVPLWK